MWTWVTGILLLGVVYYMGGAVLTDEPAKISVGAGTGISLAVILLAFFVYDILWKQLAKQEMAGAIISFVLSVGVAFGLSRLYSGRAVYIHMGAVFGTIMFLNVWMRIWPNQRRIIAATKEGKAPDAAWPAMAGLRSKHNTYMSMPLIFFMISNHYPEVYGNDYGWAFAAGYIAVGWLIAKLSFSKSATEAPKSF
jgi:uncharacterized membrane protein